MKKELQKNLSFVLFVMAVFFAGMSLTVFQDEIWMACIAGVLLLATTVFYVLSRERDTVSPVEKTSDILLADRMAELMRGNEKAEKGVYIAIKKQHEAMESGLAALDEKLTELIKAQESAVKTLVMYNKENAKQMALSEREELGLLREEMKRLQQNGGTSASMSGVVDAVREMSHRLYEELHETGEAVLSELETTVDCLEEMKEAVNKLSDGGVIQVAGNFVASQPEAAWSEPEEPEELFVTEPEPEEPEELFVAEPEPEEPEELFVAEPEPEEPEDMFASSGVDLSDPNRPLSADDIAALFAQAEGAAEEPVTTEEEPAEEKPEDMFASSGVDLSDPNRPLSADDIAALFAQAEGAAEEPVTAEEEPAEEKPEDALASSGVDLSDPNRTLSADDIAALVASLGN